MYLHALQTAVPPQAYSQQECWRILCASAEFNGLKERSRRLMEKVLLGDSGIQQRYLAVEGIERLFRLDGGELNAEFEHHGPLLARRALGSALEAAGMSAASLDALIICSCTGYLCPGISSYVAESLGMRPNAFLQDLLGHGCGAAVPALRAADAYCARQPQARVAVVAVEVCSAAFYLDDDPGVLISNCLFGDGAAAVVCSAEGSGQDWCIHDFDTIHQPQHRELLRFTNRGGKLRNQLHRSVPEVAAPMVAELHSRARPDAGTVVLSHTGGRDVLDALEDRLALPELTHSRRVLRDYGNQSSPSVLFTLREALDQDVAADDFWLTAFGAGFAAHSCRMSRGV
jgi:alkylresorcinol/alkylpyrone synthase